MRQNFSNNEECFTDGKHFCSLLGSEYRLSNQQRQLFEVWNIPDPVEAWECPRITGIEGLQGNGNTVVKRGCAEAGLW